MTDIGTGVRGNDQKVFVVHGRDKRARREVFHFLRAIGLDPIEWQGALAHTSGGAPYIGNVLDAVMKEGYAVIVLSTPDEIAYLKPEHADHDEDPDVKPAGQARPNVLFEAGMAMAKLPERTVLVEFGRVRAFTDLGGRFVVRLDNSAKSRNVLAQRLAEVGCAVRLNGNDWLSAGDLTPPGIEDTPTGPLEQTNTGQSKLPTSISTGNRPLEFGNFNPTLDRRGRPVIHGRVTNKGPVQTTLLVKATLYDNAGKIIGSASGTVNELAPAETKTFTLTTTDDITGEVAYDIQVDLAL